MIVLCIISRADSGSADDGLNRSPDLKRTGFGGSEVALKKSHFRPTKTGSFQSHTLLRGRQHNF